MSSPTSSSTEALPPDSAATDFEPPGGILVWIIVFLELLTFGAGLAIFLYQKGNAAEEFAAGSALLSQPSALINTLVLLTGGWFMINTIGALRRGSVAVSLRWMSATIVSGIAFLVIKGLEYSHKIDSGIGFGNDSFFTLYYAITGFHFLHVLAGVLILLYMAVALKRGRYTTENHFDIESGAVFWHMCDIIWLLIYPVIYLF